MTTASYDAANQQLTFGGATMTLDLNGNLATLTDGSGTTTYTWNAQDQLTALNGPSLTASFGYDGLGRRRTKTVNTARTDFLYDGLNPVQEGILLTRTDAAGRHRVHLRAVRRDRRHGRALDELVPVHRP